MGNIRLHTKFIVLLTGAALIPLIVVSAVTFVRFQSTLEADASKLGHQIAATASAEISSFMVSQFTSLANIATLYDPNFPIRPADAGRLLDTILLRSDDFTDISVVDKDGKEIVRKNKLLVVAAGDLRDMSTSQEFATVRESGVYVGPLYINNGRPFFDIARQMVGSSGEFLGAVFAQVDARVTTSVVTDISRIVDKPGRVYIVNERGVVIAHPDLSYVLGEKDLSALPSVSSIAGGSMQGQISFTYANELGDRVLGSAHPLKIEIPGLGSNDTSGISWFVVAEQPEASVYSDARKSAIFSLIFALFVVLVAAAAAVFFAGRVARPIEALHTAATEFGKGNLSYRARVESHDEIGDLAQSFNTTADALAKTVASLKNEEQVITAERNKLSLILGGITNAVIAVDLDRKIILFNKAAEELTGRAADTVFGKPVPETIHVFEGDKEINADEYCPSGAEGVDGPVFDKKDLRMQDAKGREHYVNLVAGRIREGKSIGLGCILTFQDITREYLMDKTKREFVSIAAHQLRTPLTGMSWTIEALLTDAKGALNDVQKQLIERGRDTVRTMIGLVNDLLDVSRIEEGKFGIAIQRLDIGPVLENVLVVMRKEAAKKGVELKEELPSALPQLDIDPNKVEFVLNNIIDNAIKYTPKDGRVTVRAEIQAKEFVISVQDTGIGIPAAEYDRVFTKFFRSKKAVTSFTDGSGLGLYVAKNIMDQLHGRVMFESKEGEGTTFRIMLPVPDAVSAQGSVPPSVGSPSASVAA